MANLQGYTMSAVGNMLNHYTRHYADPDQSKYTYANINIDTSKTKGNYVIKAREYPEQFIRWRLEQLGIKPSKNTNVISDWIVTLPDNPLLIGREEEFFDCVYDFLLEETGGEDNLVGAWVHTDETSLHIHYGFLAVLESTVMTNDKTHPLRWTAADEKRNPAHIAGEVKRDSKGTVRYERVPKLDGNGYPVKKATLSQAKMFDKKRMQSFHEDLDKHLQQHFGFPTGVLLENKGDHILSKLDHEDYKAAKAALRSIANETKQATADLEILQDKRDVIRQQTDKEAKRLEDLQHMRERAAQRVSVLESLTTNCRAERVTPISHKGSIFDRICSQCVAILKRLGVGLSHVVTKVQGAIPIRVRTGVNEDASSLRPLGNNPTYMSVMPNIQQQKQKQHTPGI